MFDDTIRSTFADYVKTTLGSNIPVYYGHTYNVPVLPAVIIRLDSITQNNDSLGTWVDEYEYAITYIAPWDGSTPPEQQAFNAVLPFANVVNRDIGSGFAGLTIDMFGPTYTFMADVQREEPITAVTLIYRLLVPRRIGE